jgi:SLOG cluster2/TIR domain
MTTPVRSAPLQKTYQQQLAVYVVHHPRFEPGAKLALRLYDHLTRDSSQKLARGIGIPVYLRSTPWSPDSEAPRPIPLDQALHTVVIALVDETMVLRRNEGWNRYLADLHAQTAQAPDRHRLLPVKLDDGAFSVAEGLESANFIRPPEGIATADWLNQLTAILDEKHEHGKPRAEPFDLLIPITHEICRLLLSEPQLNHEPSPYTERIGQPVQVFISHTKVDEGVKHAKSIRDYISQNLQLRTFFDTNDIPPGAEFERILQDATAGPRVALLVIQTDEYSTREWCQREILWAKKHGRPVLILHGVRYGEKCSFPYMGNAPAIRFDPDKGPETPKAVAELLLEFLRSVHFRKHFESLKTMIGLGDEVRPLPQTPELVTILDVIDSPSNKAVRQVVYQEPPLGEHLLDVLRRFAPKLSVTTPVQLLTTGRRPPASPPPLARRIIGLSLGNSPDLPRLGFHEIHADDFAAEFARYLLQAGAVLAYGGTLQAGGFTSLLRDLVWTYDASEDKTPRLLGYLAWPYHRGTLEWDPAYKEWMDPKNLNRVDFDFLPLPEGVAPEQVGPPTDRTPANLLVYARCLTAMRQKMEEKIEARVLLGGKLTGYAGRYPGLVEEALLAKRSGKPVFLIGGFGGAAGAVIDALLGRKPKALTEAHQFEDPDYKQMVALHNDLPGVDRVNYAELTAEFKKWGLAGLRKSNGLSKEENVRLFETPHVFEMVYLVLKGLMKKFAGK